jgi:hypothetical protein
VHQWILYSAASPSPVHRNIVTRPWHVEYHPVLVAFAFSKRSL